MVILGLHVVYGRPGTPRVPVCPEAVLIVVGTSEKMEKYSRLMAAGTRLRPSGPHAGTRLPPVPHAGARSRVAYPTRKATTTSPAPMRRMAVPIWNKKKMQVAIPRTAGTGTLPTVPGTR